MSLEKRRYIDDQGNLCIEYEPLLIIKRPSSRDLTDRQLLEAIARRLDLIE